MALCVLQNQDVLTRMNAMGVKEFPIDSNAFQIANGDEILFIYSQLLSY